MRLRKRTKVLENEVSLINEDLTEIENDAQASFDQVATDVRALNTRIDQWGQLHLIQAKDLKELKDELATNGVVSRLGKLFKAHEALVEAVEHLHEELHTKLDSLERNGVATSINKLNSEVFNTEKEVKSPINGIFGNLFLPELSPTLEPTLAGKVDAIIAHLGLDLSVEPAKKVASKVVAKKVVTKKKGRR